MSDKEGPFNTAAEAKKAGWYSRRHRTKDIVNENRRDRRKRRAIERMGK